MDWLAKVPDVVWAAIGGSLLTLLGVGLQNLAESSRLKRRLDHDAKERAHDRNLQLRRDVYLQAADSALRARRALLDIANTNKPLTEIGQSADPVDFGGLAKTHLVGSLETIRAVQVIGDTLASQMLLLFEARFEFEEARVSVELIEQRVAQLQSFRDQYLAGVRQLAEQRTLSPEETRSYLQTFEQTQGELDKALQERTEAQPILQARQRELLFRSISAALEYGSAVARANVTVRSELEQDVGFDPVEYERLIQESSRRHREAWQDFVRRMSERFAQL